MLRRKLSAGTLKQRRFSTNDGKGNKTGTLLKAVERVPKKVSSFGDDSAGKSSVTNAVSKCVDAKTEAKNAKKLFTYMIHCLPKVNEKNCVRQLEEMYFSEVSYLENVSKLIQAKKLMLELKHNKTCMEIEGSKYCKHKIKRKKCDEKTGNFVPLVEPEDVDLVFIPLTAIQEMHEKLLATLRQDLSLTYETVKAGKPISVTNIIRAFSVEYSKLAPYWVIYVEYIKKFQTSLDTLQRLKDDIVTFESELVKMEKELRAPVMYLINQPLMRVTKYPLLFKSLQKRVQALVANIEEPSRKIELMELTTLLNKVFSVINKTVDKVNTKIGLARNMEEMCRINSEIGDKLKKTVLLQPSRKFSKEFLINRFEVGEDIVMNTPCLALVFNDLIIVAADSTDFAKTKRVLDSSKHASQTISILRRGSAASSVSVSSHLLSLSSIQPNASQRSRALSHASLGTPSRQLRGSKKKNRKTSTKSQLKSNIKRNRANSSYRNRQNSLNSNPSVGHISNSRQFRSSMLFRSRKKKVVEENSSVRNLTPVAEMKLHRLISPEIKREQVGMFNYYVLQLTYDEFVGDKDINVKFYFISGEHCNEMKQLFKSLREEYCANELKLQSLALKRKGSFLTKYDI